jgi:hypothetical protein
LDVLKAAAAQPKEGNFLPKEPVNLDAPAAATPVAADAAAADKAAPFVSDQTAPDAAATPAPAADAAPGAKTAEPPKCGPGEILVGGQCVKAPPMEDAAADAPAEKKTPWAAIAIGGLVLGGIVWAAARAAAPAAPALQLNPRRGMTKAEAQHEFKVYVLPAVVERYGPGDKVAVREAWNDWTDALCKERRITLKQYESWDNPY